MDLVLTDGAINGFLVDETFVLYAQSVQSTRGNQCHIVEVFIGTNRQGSAFQSQWLRACEPSWAIYICENRGVR